MAVYREEQQKDSPRPAEATSFPHNEGRGVQGLQTQGPDKPSLPGGFPRPRQVRFVGKTTCREGSDRLAEPLGKPSFRESVQGPRKPSLPGKCSRPPEALLAGKVFKAPGSPPCQESVQGPR
ncbi:hypothetical protein D1007_62390 [Hordeum vulgare]|nr:hypothetical protein D1007_62390 [Hordeum vulgare]